MPGSFLLGLLELGDVFSKGVGPQGGKRYSEGVLPVCIDVFVSVFVLFMERYILYLYQIIIITIIVITCNKKT
jgi:hypothetical protein